jgi:hypothetical protein
MENGKREEQQLPGGSIRLRRAERGKTISGTNGSFNDEIKPLSPFFSALSR